MAWHNHSVNRSTGPAGARFTSNGGAVPASTRNPRSVSRRPVVPAGSVSLVSLVVTVVAVAVGAVAIRAVGAVTIAVAVGPDDLGVLVLLQRGEGTVL
jgi:hypothetical protein